MFSRGNKGKDKLNEQIETRPQPEGDVQSSEVSRHTMSRDELFAENQEAKKIYEEIASLRKSVQSLKNDDISIETETGSGEEHKKNAHMEESREIAAAKEAIIQQARRDAEKERLKQEQQRQKELEAKKAQEELRRAQIRAALVEEEAERKRRQAAEAERRAKEISRKKALDDMEAEMQASNGRNIPQATPEEMERFFGGETEAEIEPEKLVNELEAAKNELLSAQQQQGEIIEKISEITDKHTEKLAEEQQERLTQQQILLKQEQEKLQTLLDEHKSERLAREEQQRREKALKEQRARVERLMKEDKAKRKQEEKVRKAEEKERIKREKRQAAENAKLERKRLEEKSKADAELGGGVVNVKGVTINTKIKDTLHISLKDLLGIADRKERKEVSEEKTQQMKEERERRREEAREIVELSMKERLNSYESTPFGRKMRTFKNFCETHKKGLLTSGAVVIMLLVGIAGVFNYYTAYEYSYNGKILGMVKEKDDVLRITDMVQNALTEDKNVDVIIDAKDDISFKRVATIGDDIKIDTSEEVLKRLTYMGDLNVKAYGIYIDGKKAGAVESKEAAAKVLTDIKDRYSSKREGAEIEEAVFIEDVEVKSSNTDLQDILSEKEMVEKLCTSGAKVTMHKVVAGDTLASLAKFYSVTEEDIMKDNPNVNQKKLEVGSVLKINQTAPVLTVKITERVTYDKVIEHKVEEKDDPELYEGYTETTQKGKDGLSEITSRIVLVNGEEKEETPLVTTVKKDPVTEVVMVGSKERPPTVGSGKYIWPVSGGYTLTSEFGSRWGRMHEGIDLGLSIGTDILAADGGTVTYAGYSGAYGYLVEIDHQNGMTTRYAHNSSLLVSRGDKVFQGQHIAESGNSGRSTGPHLHFEIRVGGSAKNPMNYLP